MLKKLLVLSVVMLFALGLVVACEAPEEATYQDGTYTGVSTNANERGYVEVTLTIAGDEITDVSIVEYDAFGQVKDYETYGIEGAFDGTVLKEAHETLAAAIKEANDWDVDVVSGATGTSEKTRTAARMALERALVKPVSDNTYFDGTFFGVSDKDERGNIVVALVTIENDTIVAVTLSEATYIDEEGAFAWKDYEEYGVEGIFTGEDLKEAHETLAARMVEANSWEVETVTGATGTSNKAIQAAERAMAAALR